jgi:phosphonate transport system ATP-binding protein
MTPRGHPPSCELTGVTLAYGDVTAVTDLSLRVAPGETVALVGPSGAGKTSLLRMLAGMLPASSGTVRLQGQPVDGLSRDLPRLVGMMQQRLELVGELAVKHNVQAGALGRWGVLRSLAALLLPLEYPPARAAAERVGLTDKFGVRVARLSGGEQQRVALARLLVQDPAVMLADEPVAALDPALAEDLVALLCALAREGDRTLVASLHTPELARAHFDRLVGLRAGQLTFDLPSDQVGAGDLAALYERASPAPAASSPSGDGLARNAPQGDDARR